MQDQPELGCAPGQGLPLCAFLSDLPERAGGVSLRQLSKDGGVPGRQSGHAVECGRPSSALPPLGGEAGISGGSCEALCTSTSRGPDPGEHSGAWGEFEVFQESSASSELFSQSFELRERPAASQPWRTTSAQKEHSSSQPHQGGVTGTSAIAPSEKTLPDHTSVCVSDGALEVAWRAQHAPLIPPVLSCPPASPFSPVVSCEDVFKSAFQEVPVPQATESISTLDHFLETRNEEKSGLESVHKLCSESRKLWRALHNTGTTTISRCVWSESRSRENFLPVLGVDAAQKSLSGNPGHTLGEPGLHEPEELGFRLQHCRALIQTKLSGTSGGGQGSLITYSLFLKTPVHGNGQYITIPRKKKIFSPRNLKLTLFNSDIC
uniref:Clathrin binding box of aftiphilin containing 1 n=1 Tax=Moschus moschiferus TaxID=68415 RepID=A0A8C6E6Q2_MOSMO